MSDQKRIVSEIDTLLKEEAKTLLQFSVLKLRELIPEGNRQKDNGYLLDVIQEALRDYYDNNGSWE